MNPNLKLVKFPRRRKTKAASSYLSMSRDIFERTSHEMSGFFIMSWDKKGRAHSALSVNPDADKFQEGLLPSMAADTVRALQNRIEVSGVICELLDEE